MLTMRTGKKCSHFDMLFCMTDQDNIDKLKNDLALFLFSKGDLPLAYIISVVTDLLAYMATNVATDMEQCNKAILASYQHYLKCYSEE